MGRWAEAFNASIVRRDTADTADTSPSDAVAGDYKAADTVDTADTCSVESAAPDGPCVRSVNSVTQQQGAAWPPPTSLLDPVSPVSAVLRPTENNIAAAAVVWCERRAAEVLDGYEPPPPPPD